jgi:tRNA(fMet)-specific endonuclease VapC
VAVNPILLDTNAYSAFKRGDGEAVRIVQRAPLIALNSIILGELLGGFAAGTKEAENRRELDAFLSSPRARLLSVDRATSENYARIYAGLRKAATPIPSNDIWIAASAIEHGLALFTFDNHFKQVSGLRTGATVLELS